nr:hypothetical protein [uncultured Desulfuromonas sp.]
MTAHSPYITTIQHQDFNRVGQVMSCCQSPIKMRWLIAGEVTQQWAKSGQ